MNRLVVDASVVVKLFFEEEHSAAAAACLKNCDRLLSPDQVWAESTNVVWKRQRRGEITAKDATAIVAQIARLPVETTSARDLIIDAIDVATVTGRTVYDCLYLALALREKCPLLTGDQRLFNALKSDPLGQHIRFVGNSA